MKVFRIVREKYLDSVLSGKGAQYSKGFRWNSFGTPIVYAAESRSLAVLEVTVHLDLSEDLPSDRYLVGIDIPDELEILALSLNDLPKGWDAKPPGKISQRIGDGFIQGNSAPVLRVPSSIISDEFNYLLNPLHKDFSKLKSLPPRPFRFDQRLAL
ncbi:MAG: RES family NAD+ phosphorylase [Cryomorphaceae bacterium]